MPFFEASNCLNATGKDIFRLSPAARHEIWFQSKLFFQLSWLIKPKQWRLANLWVVQRHQLSWTIVPGSIKTACVSRASVRKTSAGWKGDLVCRLAEREIVDFVCVSGSLVFPEGVSFYRQSGTTLGPSALGPTDWLGTAHRGERKWVLTVLCCFAGFNPF